MQHTRANERFRTGSPADTVRARLSPSLAAQTTSRWKSNSELPIVSIPEDGCCPRVAPKIPLLLETFPSLPQAVWVMRLLVALHSA